MNELLALVLGALSELALEKTIVYGVQRLKNREKILDLPKFESLKRSKPSIHFSKIDIVNFQRPLDAIYDALVSVKKPRCIYLWGPGGIGKTRLLEETEKLVKDRKIDRSLRWGGFFDLYHSEFHDVIKVLKEIAKNLDFEREYFSKSFWDTVAAYEQLKRDGASSHTLMSEREKTIITFRRSFHNFSSEYRPVIVFDTSESLQYESDVVQLLCEIEHHQSTIIEWFDVDLFSNAVVIVAGRYQRILEMYLENKFENQPQSFETIQLQPLVHKNAREFVELLLLQVKNINDFPHKNLQIIQDIDCMQMIIDGGGGLPVRLALLLELLLQYDLTQWCKSHPVGVGDKASHCRRSWSS